MKKDNVILIGMAGVGKSTVGRQLSGALNYRFVDLDAYIVEKDHRTPQEIIDASGESAFLEKERECMLEIELDQTVVAPGGSIIYHSGLLADLGCQATLVYLEDSFANISNRITDQYSRGIVGLKDKTLRQVFDERVDRYRECADITIDCRSKLPEQITREIIQWLQRE